MKKIKLNKKILLLFLIFIFTIFVRFYNLKITARFTRDESSDLVSIKRIIDQKDITLIGPIAEGNTGIFSSLTYYISLPFVFFSKNNPLGPALATAFYGSLTVLLIWLFLKKEKIKWLPIFLLPAIFSPYVETSRWAWNPHFIPFWQILGILILNSNFPLSILISGIIFGLTIHQHWYSIFFCLGLVFLVYKKNKNIKDIILYSIGLFISIVPFIIFDITHPPGLFFSRMLYFSPISSNNHFSIINFFIKFINTPLQFFQYISYGNKIFIWITLLLSTILLIKNIRLKKTSLNLFLVPILFQFLGLSFISPPIANRYLIPAILFFILWLAKNLKSNISRLIIISLIISSLFSLSKILSQNDSTNNIEALNKITNIIKNDLSQSNSNTFNLVVLQSPDGNTKGSRFRDLLKVQNIYPLSSDDYQNPKTLYVISYNSWDKIREDPAYEMSHFRKDSPDNYWQIENSKWIVYKIDKLN